MGHNKKTVFRSQSINTILMKGLLCGIEVKEFHSDKEEALWIKLHKKCCSVCNISKNKTLPQEIHRIRTSK